jgi:hypothetical protein
LVSGFSPYIIKVKIYFKSEIICANPKPEPSFSTVSVFCLEFDVDRTVIHVLVVSCIVGHYDVTSGF